NPGPAAAGAALGHRDRFDHTHRRQCEPAPHGTSVKWWIVSVNTQQNSEGSHLSDTAFAAPEVYAALRDAAIAGLRIIREFEAGQGHVWEHHDFPKMDVFKASGLP